MGDGVPGGGGGGGERCWGGGEGTGGGHAGGVQPELRPESGVRPLPPLRPQPLSIRLQPLSPH